MRGIRLDITGSCLDFPHPFDAFRPKQIENIAGFNYHDPLIWTLGLREISKEISTVRWAQNESTCEMTTHCNWQADGELSCTVLGDVSPFVLHYLSVVLIKF